MSALATPPAPAPHGVPEVAATPARPARRRTSGESGRTASPLARRLLGLVAVLVAVAWVFPIYWMINSAFLPLNKLQAPEPTFLPLGGTLSNFRGVVQDPTFWAAMRVSLAVVVLVLLAALVFAFLAALAVSRFRFRGRKSFILTILVVQMIPAEGLFISQYQMLDGWDLVNKVSGLALVYTAAILPFTIWMLRGFVAGVPIELEEAAMVDGLSRTGAFLRITFPLLAPGLVASGVYGFLQAWNEYTLALVVMTDPAQRTLPLWLQGLVEANRATDWGVVMAGAAVIAIPVIVFFLFVQGKMTSGLVAGAVKG
ncbi:carbohydrate ABC transporter permease [Cellulomonas fimi]|uniref:Binding-protein-dependent transport systems inner membrane component n=1 Tax=Cellulomonas fimi (strain ATCC 484 / DSM 20113 / JCM 1341 / CCUG 24087 / LMG 16345 / NBRC 15513 / NCIMB 8980 / NCTC 7547 / NRS-133) TaxID=590998 RepID=F4H504_CELFA|nr:carbohydrate ABC transporter permease [Cellulomonas fimi]AEE45484.1 binding-protein-dependent transport systems inner membrane component [Cellulomonas fimi ATCC 484]NNH07290.1 carbohydrate ABC transporter permease [Cellulomonas fimi]VEH29565.1 Inner membrane ABC transporter permease protein ycjP [Cellulomonas fimi]